MDFSSGLVGLGAVATAFATIAHRYHRANFGAVTSRRLMELVGDAELDWTIGCGSWILTARVLIGSYPVSWRRV